MKAATEYEPEHAEHEQISIHAAREGGDTISTTISTARSISIHAAREGGDSAEGLNLNTNRISIHAAREGGD